MTKITKKELAVLPKIGSLLLHSQNNKLALVIEYFKDYSIWVDREVLCVKILVDDELFEFDWSYVSDKYKVSVK
jgi:hypothetical protein